MVRDEFATFSVVGGPGSVSGQAGQGGEEPNDVVASAYCIEGHSQSAVKAGATEAELAETAWVAAALRAGGSFAHGRMAFKLAGSDRSP